MGLMLLYYTIFYFVSTLIRTYFFVEQNIKYIIIHNIIKFDKFK